MHSVWSIESTTFGCIHAGIDRISRCDRSAAAALRFCLAEYRVKESFCASSFCLCVQNKWWFTAELQGVLVKGCLL